MNSQNIEARVEEEALPELQLASRCSLEELASVKLFNRVDTKYVIPRHFIHTLLREVAADYQILELRGKRLHSYETLYFDTSDLRFFNLHQCGRKPRQKVRIRRYGTNELSFLEHKLKRKYLTKKTRIKRDNFSPFFSVEELQFLREKGVDCPVEPVLWVRFQRITLRALDGSERCTIDCGLSVEPFHGFRKEEELLPSPDFSPLAIVELKQRSQSRNSSLSRALRRYGYRFGSWSKYAMGCVLSFKGLRYNRLKPQITLLNRLHSNVQEVA